MFKGKKQIKTKVIAIDLQCQITWKQIRCCSLYGDKLNHFQKTHRGNKIHDCSNS